MARVKVPYLVEKNGAYYFQPSARLRAENVEPRAFGPDEGAAIEWIRNWQKTRRATAAAPVAAQSPKGRGRVAPAPARPGSVAATIAEFRASARYRTKAAKTRKDYDLYLNRIEAMWGPAPLRAISPDALAVAYDELHKRSPSSALNFGAVARLFFKWAAKRKRLPDPTTALELAVPARSRRVWTADEVLHLVAVADRPAGQPGADRLVGTAVLALLFLPHNPQDILRLTVGHILADRFAVTRGKTGRVSWLAVPDPLAARILADAPRLPDGSADPTARILPGLDVARLGKRFAAVRTAAAQAVPSVADLELRQLRRTARSMAEAGQATQAMSANLLGHSQQQAARLATNYSVAGPELGAAALEAMLRSAAGAALLAGLGADRKKGTA